MTDHAAAALTALQCANEACQDPQPFFLAEAQIHATLEQAKWAREIADQLDIRNRPRPTGRAKRFPLHDAAEMLEGLAIGDEGPAREMTIARLVLHQVIPYPDAEQIAGGARLLAQESGDPWRLVEVDAAITILKIEIPVVDADVVDERQPGDFDAAEIAQMDEHAAEADG